jgi:hypothetical protein
VGLTLRTNRALKFHMSMVTFMLILIFIIINRLTRLRNNFIQLKIIHCLRAPLWKVLIKIKLLQTGKNLSFLLLLLKLHSHLEHQVLAQIWAVKRKIILMIQCLEVKMEAWVNKYPINPQDSLLIIQTYFLFLCLHRWALNLKTNVKTDGWLKGRKYKVFIIK